MPLLNYDVSLLIFSPCLFYFDLFVMTKALLSMIQFLSYGNSVTGLVVVSDQWLACYKSFGFAFILM